MLSFKRIGLLCLLIPVVYLTGCETISSSQEVRPSSAEVFCTEYAPAFLSAAADSLDELPNDDPLRVLLADYASGRAATCPHLRG